MNWIKEVAPLLGAALGGPLGGAAATFIASKLGLEANTVEAVQEVLQSGRMTPDQITAMKLAELDFQKFLKENDIKLEQLVTADRADARRMAVETSSPVPAYLSIGVTVGYFAILIGMMVGWFDVKDSTPMMIMLGSLSTAWGVVMSFWFGTTRSSSEKNHIIAQAATRKE